VSALVDLVEVADVGVDRIDPAARGSPDLAGEGGEADRNRDLRSSGGACPDAWAAARARPSSQYDRAAETPVPVSQYSVMLSTMVSRVRLPAGFPSTKAPEIL
jgi:hypothetical protein